MYNNSNKKLKPTISEVPTPKQIMKYLDERVIGQTEAKKRLAVAVHNHYLRLQSAQQPAANDQFADVVLEKSNILMLGETGTGKTFLIKCIAEMLGVPIFIQDCTKLTASGYVGEDVENCLTGLLKKCNYNVHLAEMGIVCLDEVDKIAKKGENVSITRDVSGECVQQGLLKLVEGSRVGVMPEGGRKHPEQPLVMVDTSNILFIAMGAFVGIDKMIEHRTTQNTAHIGFGRPAPSDAAPVADNPLRRITTEDLTRFGMIPEFIGRFPVVTHTNHLTPQDMRRIISQPKNSILHQYEKLFHLDGKELIIQDDVLDVVVEAAVMNKTGARGLRGIFETILTDLMFEMVGSRKRKIVVTADYARSVLNLEDPCGAAPCGLQASRTVLPSPAAAQPSPVVSERR